MTNFVEEIVPSYSDKTFREHFRMSQTVVNIVIERFRLSAYYPHINNKLKVSAKKSVYLCLWYLAAIRDRFNVGISTSHSILIPVIDFILSLRDEYIKWPNDQEKDRVSKEFKKKTRI